MKLRLITTALIAFGMATAAQAEVSIIDFTPLYKETVAASPGIEMIQPTFTDVDTDADGLADSFRVGFNVFPANSATKLFSTTPRLVAYPAVPCTNPSWVDSDFSAVKFLGGTSASRSHVAIGMFVECQEADAPFEWKEAKRTLVYSAAVNAAGGTMWSKVYNYALLNFDGIDVNADGTNELVLGLEVPVTVPTSLIDAGNLRSIAINGGTGAVVFDVTRLLVR